MRKAYIIVHTYYDYSKEKESRDQRKSKYSKEQTIVTYRYLEQYE